ncbi:MAG: TlpA family protein disulfide reductase [Verrucomicrobia bacterium]|nr:TlpA family protein disulfide reductase [Verrucomicrobiota bacterium]
MSDEPALKPPRRAFAILERKRLTRREKWLLASVLVLGLATQLLYQPIQGQLRMQFVLDNEAPAEAAIDDLVWHFKNPAVPLKRLWRSQQIPHRLAVLSYVQRHADKNPELLSDMEPVLIAAAQAGDLEGRAAALALLAKKPHPQLVRLAKLQLRDADPAVRVLGVQALQRAPAAGLVPVIFPLLDDPDPRVVVVADSALRRWTGHDSGLRLAHALPQFTPIDGQVVESADCEAIKRGVQRWKEWWPRHQADYPIQGERNSEHPVFWRLPTPDFALQDLRGKEVKLSGFKGRLVLLNFWDTTTVACLSFVTNLTELQRRSADRLVVLGISLDSTAAERSHEHEHAHEHGAHSPPKPDLGVTRAQLEQTVEQTGINYRVLLDETGALGRRFSAMELPTTVLLDAEGFVRRRFVGLRDVETLTAMLNEIDLSKTAPE